MVITTLAVIIISTVNAMIICAWASKLMGQLAEEIGFLENRLEYLEKLNNVALLDTEDE